MKKRNSMDYTIARIMEYLYDRGEKSPVSKGFIVKNSGIATQRPDRLKEMFRIMGARGWVSDVKTEHATFHRITELGLLEYEEWIVKYLAFAGDMIYGDGKEVEREAIL